MAGVRGRAATYFYLLAFVELGMLNTMFQTVVFSSNLYQHIIDVFVVFLSFSVVLSCCTAGPGLAIVAGSYRLQPIMLSSS